MKIDFERVYFDEEGKYVQVEAREILYAQGYGF